jgi:alanine-glyoxylate transaminase/serine-glyoxylate transaminase/serine-pyruvate transaminase
MIRERHLFGPGPSNPYPEATRALGEPLLGHLDPEFLRIMDETCDMLRTVRQHRAPR